MNPLPTKHEVDEIISKRKIVSSSVSWKSVNSGWRLEANVLEPESNNLFRLVGVVGKSNFSFSLLYKNFPIRKYTSHARHVFNGIETKEPHKHIWSAEYEDKEVYIPHDINPISDINHQFLDFCNECKIDLLGGYQNNILFIKNDNT